LREKGGGRRVEGKGSEKKREKGWRWNLMLGNLTID
jgi:hypothetical protein